jgi:hypothetical protein
MTYNLKMADSYMPQIVGHILLAFYKGRISSILCMIIIMKKAEASTRDKL